jgi:hypothetical protein
VIGLFDREVNNKLDLESIEAIKLIEPQNGFYLGSAINNGLFSVNNKDHIFSIITEEDYYLNGYRLLKNNDLSWYSYGYYLEKINEIK